jgi:hypothetical protein
VATDERFAQFSSRPFLFSLLQKLQQVGHLLIVE